MGCCASNVSPPQATERCESEGTLMKRRRTNSVQALCFSTASFVFQVQEHLTTHYRVVNKIGEGGYGNVWKVIHKPTGQIRAVKNLSKAVLPRDQEQQMLREVGILKDLVYLTQDHPNILKIFEVIEDATSFHIVTELCTGGDLFERVSAISRFSESVVANYMHQILLAVSYCHQRHIVHRDLKPENLLLISKEPDSLLKVIDFGTSTKFNPRAPFNNIIGTLFYMAPEVLDELYDEKCDIWSCGVVMYILMSDFHTGGQPPFNGRNDQRIMDSIKEAKVSFENEEWNSVSADAKKFIMRMLTKDPKKRASAQELLSDKWLTSKLQPAESNLLMKTSSLANMRNFRSGCKLHHATLQLIAWQFAPPEATEPLKRVFISLDADKDGKLSRRDLEVAFQQVFPSHAENVDAIMQAIDCDHNGFIEYHEFLIAALNWQQILTPDVLQNAFRAFDKDGNGTIDLEEVRSMLQGEQDVATPVWGDVMREADSDGKGVVTFTQIDLQAFSAMAMRAVRKMTVTPPATD